MDKFKFEILVGMLYPKIDAAVSSHTNHLLKAPFNIHSSSLLLSVPVDPEKFDIAKIPSLVDIVRGNADMTPYLRHFREFIKNLEAERREGGSGKENRDMNKREELGMIDRDAELQKQMRKVKI